jgi:hypothetical protein
MLRDDRMIGLEDAHRLREDALAQLREVLIAERQARQPGRAGRETGREGVCEALGGDGECGPVLGQLGA